MKWIVSWTCAVGLGLAAGKAAGADTWTNVAGHVVSARLLAVENEQALLQTTNGRLQRVLLASLKPADRERARAQTGFEPLPAGLKALFEQAQQDIQRAAQFLHGGKITRDQFKAHCQTVRQRFEHFALQGLKEDGAPADPSIVEKLARRLDQAGKSAETAESSPAKAAGT